MRKTKSIVPAEYAGFLMDLKQRIRNAHITAARAVNRELILLYWDIGHAIVKKQRTANWGDSVVERLSADLRAEFPEMRGFSANNMWLMRQFYSEYRSPEFLEQAVQELRKRGRQFLTQVVPELDRLGRDFLEQPAPKSTGGTTPVASDSQFLEQLVQETAFWRQLVATIPWGHHIELLKKVKSPPARPRLVFACHRPIRLVPPRAAEPNQSECL